MKFGQPTHRERQMQVDITSMIDVVFLLIVFFMATAQFVRTSRAEVDLPREMGEQDEQPDEAGLVINIDAEGRIVVNDRVVTLDTLAEQVREQVRDTADGQPEGVKLLIRADRTAGAGSLNAVVRRLEELGVGAGRLATAPPSR